MMTNRKQTAPKTEASPLTDEALDGVQGGYQEIKWTYAGQPAPQKKPGGNGFMYEFIEE